MKVNYEFRVDKARVMIPDAQLPIMIDGIELKGSVELNVEEMREQVHLMKDFIQFIKVEFPELFDL